MGGSGPSSRARRPTSLKVGLASLDKLLFEVGQLDLISARPARDAAKRLYANHALLSFALWLASRPQPRMAIPQIRQQFPITPQRLERLENDFIARVRADLGFTEVNRWLRWRRREMPELDKTVFSSGGLMGMAVRVSPPPSGDDPPSAAGGGERGDDPSRDTRA